MDCIWIAGKGDDTLDYCVQIPRINERNWTLNQLIIWDWNGTLLDDVDACVQAVNILLGKRKMQTINREIYRDVFAFPVIDYYKAIGFNLERESFEDLAGEYVSHYLDIAKTARLQEGAANILQRFKSQGCRQIILSAMETSALKKQIERYGLLRYFDIILGSENIQAHGKISIAQDYFQKTGHPTHAVMIGDTYHDYEVANALGCRCALVKNGHQNLDRFRFNHDTHLTNSLPELEIKEMMNSSC
jgi:phosphoglycolate phosphatase